MKLHSCKVAAKAISKNCGIWLGIGVAVVVLLIPSAQAQTMVNACGQTLSSPGQYLLATNLDCSHSLANGINVTASGVVLHLGGRTLSSTDCDGTKGIAGIAVSPGANGVQIDGGTVTGFNDGIDIASANSRVSGVNVTGACFFGIALSGQNNRVDTSVVTLSGMDGVGIGAATGTHIESNNISNNARVGVDISNFSSGNFVENNVINNNGILDGEQGGVAIFNGKRNLISNNTINNNFNGIELESPGNTVRNNTVSGSVGAGIFALVIASPSSVKGNTVLGSGVVDMSDDSPNCGKDKWQMNYFQTDLVNGKPDGGPGVGCLQ